MSEILSCHICGIMFTPGKKYLPVETEKQKYTFCEVCVKAGFSRLSALRKKTLDEVMLMAKFRKWLKLKVH